MNNSQNENKVLSSEQQEQLFLILRKRFEQNMNRHKGMKWEYVEKKLKMYPKKLWSVQQMEETGGEPDVVDLENTHDVYTFIDCSQESPLGRRNLCYDRESLEMRKTFKPKNSAVDVATEMGITLLTEEQYKQLQTRGNFDEKTSSWIQTPDDIRKLDGALFGDRRYNTVFIYHNGASSYYSARGFRGLINM